MHTTLRCQTTTNPHGFSMALCAFDLLHNGNRGLLSHKPNQRFVQPVPQNITEKYFFNIQPIKEMNGKYVA